MKLKDVIFTDGVVKSYEFSQDAVAIRLIDYRDNELIISLQGNIKGQERGSVDSNINRSTLSRDGNQYTLDLEDDDNQVVLSVTFMEGTVEIVP